MEYSSDFLSQILNSMSEHIAVINEAGDIKYVNERWNAFSSIQWDDSYSLFGENYLSVCDKAALEGDEFGEAAGKGIRSVINQEGSNFYLEYPCGVNGQQRWFMMRVTPFELGNKRYFVLVHQEVTERKLAEEKVNALAREDSLTELPNRRAFDEFLTLEWQSGCSSNDVITLAILDLDYFKYLNDSYGHQAGDMCLIKIGKQLREFMEGRDGMCARYGGEEFVIVLKGVTLSQAVDTLSDLLVQIADLKIANENAPNNSYLTTSIGVAQIIPNEENRPEDIINKADSMLYKAKSLGRNRIMYSS
ncbi:sensor domain-containing diguanylate cyclase [Marinomonas sp. C2222]|uniref:diguanylate cyclase n=1 Tax=Marinomonas sargassi TaxID=2984494 RepID=A0ABT2YR95_9GAMM|nr:sensor domain-containing diguanylate cyclase [Marinomonas sargassi]MCV2402417.1 sensor domain-containing diguanylate cyclase [Marinomonas sargassi]